MKNEIIGRIIDKLNDYEESEVYSCDLAYTLFEDENIDGTFTYNTYEAKEWIKSNWEEIGEVWEELNFQFDSEFMNKNNPFENPESFMVIIILESASYLLSCCEFIDKHWNDKITLSKKNIKTITNQLKELDNGAGIYEN